MKLKNIILVGLVALYLISTASAQISGSEEEEKIEVAVTIAPLAQVVEQIGGDKVRVSEITSITEYLSKRWDKQRIAFVLVGSGIEFEAGWTEYVKNRSVDVLNYVFSNESELPVFVINCSNGIELIEGDPHVWLSPKNVKIMANNIYEGLVWADPFNEEYYSKNRDAYQWRLDELDNEITETLSGIENRKFLVYHPAWGYFCRDYDLEQFGIEENGKKPSPSKIVEAIKYARENNVRVIAISSLISYEVWACDRESLDEIAEEIDGWIIELDPLPEHYIKGMRKVAVTLARNLE